MATKKQNRVRISDELALVSLEMPLLSVLDIGISIRSYLQTKDSSVPCRWLLILLLMFCPGIAVGQGRLDDIRQQVNQSDGASSSRTSSSSSGGDSDSGLGQLYLYAFLAPFVIPHELLDDRLDRQGYFPRHPYVEGYPGYLWLGNWPNGDCDESLRSELNRERPWSVRFTAEEGNDFRGMNRVGIRATLDTTSRFGLQSNWNFLGESLGNNRRDTTTLGDTNVTYRFAQDEVMQFYTGLGFRVLTDPSTTNFGVNFVYGFNYFPKKPWVFSSAFDVGNLGSAAVLHGRSTVGVTMNHFELFAGYDFLRIGTLNVQGPMLGLRFWY